MLSRSHRRVLKALLPMVLSGCAVSQSLTDRLPKMGRDRYSEQLLAARMAEQSGELLRARKSYEELLKRHPDKVDLHHRLGVLCQKSGDEQAAISYLSRAHELSPTNVEVLCDLGYSQYLQGKTQEAVEVYRKAQQINPSHPRTQTNLGIALIDIGEISTAMTTLRQSMSESDAASTVGFALVQKGDLLQAREYFTRAIDSDPTSQKAAEALVQLGELLAAEHNVAQGLPAAENPAGRIGTATESEAPSGAPASRPETVNFESLYSQKIEQPVKSGTQTIPAAAAAVENTVPLSASGHAVVDSFRASADENAGVALPPIESVQRREQTTVGHSNNSSKVQLSHTSLRADESAASARFSADVSDGLEDLGEFVESSPASSPVQGIRSLDERRRSGGLIEPMLGSNARARRSEGDRVSGAWASPTGSQQTQGRCGKRHCGAGTRGRRGGTDGRCRENSGHEPANSSSAGSPRDCAGRSRSPRNSDGAGPRCLGTIFPDAAGDACDAGTGSGTVQSAASACVYPDAADAVVADGAAGAAWIICSACAADCLPPRRRTGTWVYAARTGACTSANLRKWSADQCGGVPGTDCPAVCRHSAVYRTSAVSAGAAVSDGCSVPASGNTSTIAAVR
jgi:Tfp pilus assembly protein PilF